MKLSSKQAAGPDVAASREVALKILTGHVMEYVHQFLDEYERTSAFEDWGGEAEIITAFDSFMRGTHGRRR
jgi:hypothetical protein